MRFHIFLRGCAFIVLAFCSLAVVAQDPIEANSVNTGIPQNAILTGSDIDNVQVNNGNLHIEIPIAVTPGRGDKDLSILWKYVYDSKGWLTSEYDDANGYHFSIKQELQNNMAFATISNFGYYRITKSSMVQGCSGVRTTIYYNFVLREPDGTKHHFEPDPTYQDACTNYPNTRYADDGSG